MGNVWKRSVMTIMESKFALRHYILRFASSPPFLYLLSIADKTTQD